MTKSRARRIQLMLGFLIATLVLWILVSASLAGWRNPQIIPALVFLVIAAFGGCLGSLAYAFHPGADGTTQPRVGRSLAFMSVGAVLGAILWERAMSTGAGIGPISGPLGVALASLVILGLVVLTVLPLTLLLPNPGGPEGPLGSSQEG